MTRTELEVFEGNTRIPCGWTSRHNDSTYNVTRSFTGSTNCRQATIQIVMVAQYVNNRFTRVIYVDNPHS
ncbi:hypothetical protein [Rhizohabitans arisaemae]|uniref:hypothetical protein n=1 Tax=Rhizohabitans arisaemae TaxID=2720610 RepID=UPI0024B23625|nr:hypothetical protein [Rhizohabitans arisaemae]